MKRWLSTSLSHQCFIFHFHILVPKHMVHSGSCGWSEVKAGIPHLTHLDLLLWQTSPQDFIVNHWYVKNHQLVDKGKYGQGSIWGHISQNQDTSHCDVEILRWSLILGPVLIEGTNKSKGEDHVYVWRRGLSERPELREHRWLWANHSKDSPCLHYSL